MVYSYEKEMAFNSDFFSLSNFTILGLQALFVGRLGFYLILGVLLWLINNYEKKGRYCSIDCDMEARFGNLLHPDWLILGTVVVVKQ